MKHSYVAICFMFILSFSCTSKKKANVMFTGYTPLSISSKINFDTLNINPTLIAKEHYGTGFDTSYYWEIYNVSPEEKIVLKCSSYDALVTGNFADSLFIDKYKFSILELFKDRPVSFRIVQILKFTFSGAKYVALIGRDKREFGNRVFNTKVVLARIEENTVVAFCPPLNLDHGLSNAQSYLSDYFCNLNQDEYLDFLQWKYDTIHVYSLSKNGFIKQKEFIKLFQKNKHEDIFYIDKPNSNWPYSYFKTLERLPNPPSFKFDPLYY